MRSGRSPHTTTAATAKRKEDALVKTNKRHDNIDTNTYCSLRREIECTAVATDSPSVSGGGRVGGRKKWEGECRWRARERERSLTE
ncbi:hypothetical protein V6N12_009722 [Hibiscus sabdariffa]|uniref:Uncharacterized protein n=1 Tax=Hibiscus sabdariffa TaxID=183260 RepID=A0ABR1ZZZ9_9ROSI